MEKNNLDETIGSGSVITTKDVLNEHLLQNDENNNENRKTSTLDGNEQSSSNVDTSWELNFGQSHWNCHTMGPAHKINQKSEMLLVSCNKSQYQQEKKKEDGKEKNGCSENSKRNIDEVLEHNSTVLCDVCPNLIPNSLVKQEDVPQDCMHRHKDDQMETNGIDLEVRCLMDAIKEEIKVEELKHDVTSDVNFSIENHGIETYDVLRNLNSSFSEYTCEDKQNNDMIADKTKQTNKNKGNCIKRNSQIFQLSKIPKLENNGQFDEFEWEDSKLEYSCILYDSDTQHYDCSEGTRNEKSNIHSPDTGLGNTFLTHEHLKYGIEVCEKCVNTKCQNVEINSCLQDAFDLKYETQSDDLNSEETSLENGKATINVEDNIFTSINKIENCVDCKFEIIQPEFSEKELALNMPVRCPDKAPSKDSDTGEAKWHSALNIANYQDKTTISIVDNLKKTNEQFSCKSPNFKQEHYEMIANENLNQVCPKNDDLNNQKYENETHVHTGTWRNFETGNVECDAVSIETDGYQVDVPGFDKPDTKEELAIKHCNKVNFPLVYTTNNQNVSCLLGNRTEQIHNVDDPKHNTSSDLEFSGDSELLYQAMCASGIFDTAAECLKVDSDFERNITFDNCSVEQPRAYLDANTQLVDTDDAGVCMAADVLECNECLVVFEECCNNLFPLTDLNKVSLTVEEDLFHGANNNLGYLQPDVSVIDEESEIISPWQTFESGSGQIYQYNPILLQLESLTTGRLSSDGKFGCSEMMMGEKSITASSILNNEDENADNTNDCKPAQLDARVPECPMVKLPEERLDRQACLYNMQDGGFGRNPHVIKVLPDGTVVDISQWFQCFMPEKCSYKGVSKKSKSNGTFKRKSLEKT